MTSINIILKHGFTRGGFSLLKRSLVSNKLLTSFYGRTRKSRERIKFRKVFCNSFGFSLNLRSRLWKFLWFHTLSVCPSVCLSVCLSICSEFFSEATHSIFWMMLLVNFQKPKELDFWWKIIIWAYWSFGFSDNSRKWKILMLFVFLLKHLVGQNLCSWGIAQKLSFNQIAEFFQVKCLKRESSIVGNKAKDESQNRCYKKTKHVKFSEKQTFLTPWYAL